MPTTLSLYFRASDGRIEKQPDTKDRLEREKGIRPFEEYRDITNDNMLLVIEPLVHPPKLTVSGFITGQQGSA